MVKGSLLDRLKLPSHHQDYLLAFGQPPSIPGSDRGLPAEAVGKMLPPCGRQAAGL